MILLMPDWEERCKRLDKDASYMEYLAFKEPAIIEEQLHLADGYDLPNVWEEEG